MSGNFIVDSVKLIFCSLFKVCKFYPKFIRYVLYRIFVFDRVFRILQIEDHRFYTDSIYKPAWKILKF